RPRGAAHRAYVNDVGVGRMEKNASDAAGLGEPHVRPRLAGVSRLVDAVAHDVGVADDPGFASPCPNDARIRRRYGKRANCLYRLFVEHRLERLAAVRRLPDAARRRARIVRLGVARNTSDRRDPARALGSHVAEAERLVAWYG